MDDVSTRPVGQRTKDAIGATLTDLGTYDHMVAD
jgi:hypothetical protein